MFVGLGLSAIFPVLHGVEMYGLDAMQDRIGLVWLLLQGFLYILGASLYAVSAIQLVLQDLMLTFTGSVARAIMARFF
jgi:predicted membrane channel-forming protein YqfA (hemolysin III family)